MRTLPILAVLVLVPAVAHAYIGPGAGFGILGVVAGIVGAILLALFGILWYPFKRLLKRRKARADTHDAGGNSAEP